MEGSNVQKKTRVVKTIRRVVRTNQAVTRGSPEGTAPISLPPWASTLLKCVFLDLPLLLLLLLFLGVSALLYWNLAVWFPEMQRQKWTQARAESEGTYYDMSCKAASNAIVTATHRTPLLMSDNRSTQERVDQVRLHGAGLFSNLLEHVRTATVEQFRAFALQKNRRIGNEPENGDSVDVVGVIENHHRWSFALQVGEDPSIAPLLESIGQHSVLKETLEGLLGKNPALVELSTITAERGAVDQGWHFDTAQEGDSLKFAHTFTDLYSLLIPVQNTTLEMGPTALCPGTHYCSHYEEELCDKHGFSPVNDDRIWKAGDGLLFNSHLAHQGRAHLRGPTRVALVLSFAARPHHNLQLPLAAGYVIPWNAMGFTFQDLAHASTNMVQPWATLQSLGLGSAKLKGWDYFSFCNAHMGNHRDPPQVVVMPYVKLLPIQLIGLANYHDFYSPWQVFVLDTLQRVWMACLVLYLFGVGGYAQIHSSSVETSSDSKPKGVVVPWTRLVILHASIAVAVGLVVVVTQHPTQIPPSANSSPAETVSFSEEYLQSLACPQVDDILMGPNFLDDFSKWSPGNRKWHAKAKELLPWYLLYNKDDALPCTFVDAVLEAILDNTGNKEESRVMLQNENSDWVELTHEQAKQQSIYWLHRTLVHRPDGLCAGSSKGTALCRVAVDFMDQYVRKEKCPERSTAEPTTKVVYKVKPPLGLLPSREDKESSLQGQPIIQPVQTMYRPPKATNFQVGDHVEARIRSTTRKWLRATVTEKRAGGLYMVHFDVDIPEYHLEDPLDGSLLRPIKPRLETPSQQTSEDPGYAWRPWCSKKI